MTEEETLKHIAEALEGRGYSDSVDIQYREFFKASTPNSPVLEYGDFGGNCRQLGVYGYRGFDVVVTNVHGDTPEEGKEYTIGIYNMGECDAQDMYVGEKFSFVETVKEVNSLIDFIKKSRGEIVLSRDIEASDFMGFISEGQDAFIAGKKECTCGAKHTSNPNYHMDWCDHE